MSLLLLFRKKVDGGVTATASFSQAAGAWQSEGLVANAVDAEGAWEQAAAAWVAATSQLISGTATWEQAAATWDVVASLAYEASAAFSQAPAAWTAIVSEEIAGTGTWEQAAASWQASENELVTAMGSWEQSASWSAMAAHERVDFDVHHGGRNILWRRPTRIDAVATWSQLPADWQATMAVDPRRVREDELLLVGAL